MGGVWTALLLAGVQTPYSHGTPSNEEQLVLELINRARRDPVAEGARLGISITEGLDPGMDAFVMSRPPLALNAALSNAAQGHLDDMYLNNYFAHINPATPTIDPGDRMTAAGYVFSGSSSWGENIAGGYSTAAAAEDALMIDSGISGRGHRVNLLDIFDPAVWLSSRPFREVGLAFEDKLVSKSNISRYILVQDFAKSAGSGPFLVGVVYDDNTAAPFYTPGEGRGGVTIAISSPAWGWNANTSASGGYAFPIAGIAAVGTAVDVTATGGALGAAVVTKSFYVTGDNVKVDFLVADAADGDADGLPDWWEGRYPLSADPASDEDGDFFIALAEFRFGSLPNDSTSTPANPGGGGGGGGSGGSFCGALGVEVLLLLALRRLVRRAAGN
jgi:hypothetical protein